MTVSIGCITLLLSTGAALAQSSPESLATVEDAVKDAYLREFKLAIEHPAIYNNPDAVNCRGEGHLTTTAYLREGDETTVYTMYLSRNGDRVLQKSRMTVLVAPVGKIRVLAVLVRYPETVGPDALKLWEDAQKEVNHDHSAFAMSRGYKVPLVVFENTNIVVDPKDVSDPHSPASVRAAAEHKGFSPGDYDIVMAIDINPEKSAGGHSINAERSIYVGNYGPWKAPLDGEHWLWIARTAYQHEMAHHWGWPGTHDWAGTCGGKKPEYAPFIAPPVLFGWEQLSGDSVPEILSKTPYGRH